MLLIILLLIHLSLNHLDIFYFLTKGSLYQIVTGRRPSSYFLPIAKPKNTRGGKNASLNTEWTNDRIEENELVNDIRQLLTAWRQKGYLGVTPTTARLLQYWTNPDREKKIFFCQIEAVETAIYLAEIAANSGDGLILKSAS